MTDFRRCFFVSLVETALTPLVVLAIVCIAGASSAWAHQGHAHHHDQVVRSDPAHAAAGREIARLVKIPALRRADGAHTAGMTLKSALSMVAVLTEPVAPPTLTAQTSASAPINAGCLDAGCPCAGLGHGDCTCGPCCVAFVPGVTPNNGPVVIGGTLHLVADESAKSMRLRPPVPPPRA